MRILRSVGWGLALAGLALGIVFGVWMGTGFFASWQREAAVACPAVEQTPVFVEVMQVSGRSIRVRVSNRSNRALALSQKPGESGIAVSMGIYYYGVGSLAVSVIDRPSKEPQAFAIPPGASIEREVDLAMLIEQQARDNHGRIIRAGSRSNGVTPLANVPFKAETYVGLNTELCGNVELLPPTKITIAMPNTCQFDEQCAKHGRSFLWWSYVAFLGMTNLTYEDEDEDEDE